MRRVLIVAIMTGVLGGAAVGGSATAAPGHGHGHGHGYGKGHSLCIMDSPEC